MIITSIQKTLKIFILGCVALFFTLSSAFAAAPTVITDTASSLSQTGATLSGTIQSTNGETVTTRGFEYGTDTDYGSTASESGSYELTYNSFSTLFGSGTGDGEFTNALDMAVDSSGNIHIIDFGDYLSAGNPNRIQKFDSDNNFLLEWGVAGAGDAVLVQPGSLAVDSSDNVYVFDTTSLSPLTYKIKKYTSGGTFLLAWEVDNEGTGCRATGKLAVDSSDNVYTAEGGCHQIKKYDDDGDFLYAFGSSGSGDDNFNGTGGLAIVVDSSDDVYILDPGNDRIKKHSGTNGNYIAQWSLVGDTGGTALYLDVSNNLWASSYDADFSAFYLEKFDLSGNLLDRVTSATANAYGAKYIDSSYTAYTPSVGAVYSYSLAPFTSSFTDLLCDTVYHYRSLATNTDGTSYGSDATFTTVACTNFKYVSPPTCTLYALNHKVQPGQSSTLVWTVHPPPGLDYIPFHYARLRGTADVYDTSVNHLDVFPTTHTRYVLDVFNLWGSHSCDTVVTVATTPPEDPPVPPETPEEPLLIEEPPVVTPPVCPVFTSYLRRGSFSNDPQEIIKVKRFLNEHMGETLRENSFFSKEFEEAIKRLQAKYAEAILTPWGLTKPTGYLYKTTKSWINAIEGCYEGELYLEDTPEPVFEHTPTFFEMFFEGVDNKNLGANLFQMLKGILKR